MKSFDPGEADGAAGQGPEARPASALHGARFAPAQGVAVGLADVVPGVSGGTVALALGIHPRLVAALRSLDLGLLRASFGAIADGARGRRRLHGALLAGDLPFLSLLLVGVAAGLLAGAWALTGVMERHPVLLAAFFFGLVVAAVRVPYRMMPERTRREAAWFLGAAAAAFLVTLIPGLAAPQAWWFVPVAGAIAVCAMVLPGISGAHLLLLMGLYAPLLADLRALHVPTLVLFAAGAAVGLLSFVRLLHLLLLRHPAPTLAVLTGLMVGSLGRLWPFKDGEAFGEGSNVLPGGFPEVLPAVAAALAGALVVWALEAVATRGPARKPK